MSGDFLETLSGFFTYVWPLLVLMTAYFIGTYIEKRTPKPLRPNQLNYWSNYPKFHVSLMKAWFGNGSSMTAVPRKSNPGVSR